VLCRGPTNSMLRNIQITLVALVVFSGIVANVRGTACGWSIGWSYWQHGWPLPWLARQWATVKATGSGPLGLYDPSWAWNIYPAQGYDFSTFALVVDVAALGVLAVGTYFAFPRTTSNRGRFQFG
jgi:hypothetical protein